MQPGSVFKCAVLLLGASLVSGCAVIPHIGLVYSDTARPVQYEPGDKEVYLEDKACQLLGQVRGESTVENYLGLFAMGDYGITTAYKNALGKARGADVLIDVHVDRHTLRILSFYIKSTTIVTGTAVRIAGGSAGPAPSAAPPSKPPAGGGTGGGQPPGGSESGGGGGGEEDTPWWGN